MNGPEYWPVALVSSMRWAIETRAEREGNIAPRSALPTLMEFVPNVVVELFIVDRLVTPLSHARLLLEYRNDQMWDGWHTPGGFVNVGETLHAACVRHGKKIGLDLSVAISVGQNGQFGWREDLGHPYGETKKGHLIHFYFACVAIGAVKESETLRFFGKDEMPAREKFIRGHHLHARSFLDLD